MTSSWGRLAVTVAAAMGMVASCNSPRGVVAVGPRAPSRPTAADAGTAAEGGLAASDRDGGGAAEQDGGDEVRADDPFAPIDAAVNEALAEGKTPGCVVVVGRHDEVLMRRAYGFRSIEPERKPMTLDTVFDLASLTKPIATATSIMLLVDRGLVDLDAPASRYVPELARLPRFTVRHLLMHTSGLPAATPIADFSPDRSAVIAKIGALTLKHQPDERFLYSDVGFIVLEEIVRRVSKKDLPTFSREEIFEPLGMAETGFLPAEPLRARAALTEPRDGAWIPGDVHDPRARLMGGVAGHAGLFSTADDLVRYAQAMLRRGERDGKRLVREPTFALFTAKPNGSRWGRALGWDVDSSFATHRSALYSARAFGHGGYTGTAIWIDPVKDLFVLFLSNRVHPDGKGAVNPLVATIGGLAVQASETKTGIDVLRAEGFRRIDGAHVGVVTNASAKAKDGTTTIDVLRSASNVKLEAIFTPEHGLGAEREGKVADSSHAGLPVYSLYGERFSPTSSTLDGIDTLVFDLQDAGTRFYTYSSTMKRAMKVAAEKKLRFVVLDRPNPIDGVDVQGPVLAAPSQKSFVNHHALPLRHGMTMGELAMMFAADENIEARVDVVKMQSWRRSYYYDRTGLAWTSPSPNLRTVDEVVLYPAIGMLEGTNVSVGRGTDAPFEVLGAPWIDGAALAKKLGEAPLPGVAFEATTFTPRSAVHAGKKCGGVRVRVTDREKFEPVRTGVTIALALRELFEPDWDVDKLDGLLQSPAAVLAIKEKKSAREVESTWLADLAAFKAKRERFLLYR
jgi:uncharacterized protein YbbC (DUF1343 family)